MEMEDRMYYSGSNDRAAWEQNHVASITSE